MFLIIGLGNPGSQYENTRHNIGFKILDQLSREYNFSNFNSKFNSFFAKGKINNHNILLVKPQTYMNLSGNAVSQFKKYYKIDEQNIIVIHDDLDVEFGKIKCKLAGGHGGHNGLRSIDELMGKNYWRIRYGIGRPEFKNDVSNYVLKNFSQNEDESNQIIITKLIKNITHLLDGDKDKFLTECNKK